MLKQSFAQCISHYAALRSLSRAHTHVAVMVLINRSFLTLTQHLQNELQGHQIKEVVDLDLGCGIYDQLLFNPPSQALDNNILQNESAIGLVNQSEGLELRNTASVI